MYIWGLPKNIGVGTNRTAEVYMASWAKEKGDSGLGFKGKVDNLQVDEKEQTLGEQILTRSTRNTRTQTGV